MRRARAELDKAEELDSGNPQEFGVEYAELITLLPNVNVLGGCCGTDHRHVLHIRDACVHVVRGTKRTPTCPWLLSMEVDYERSPEGYPKGERAGKKDRIRRPDR